MYDQLQQLQNQLDALRRTQVQARPRNHLEDMVSAAVDAAIAKRFPVPSPVSLLDSAFTPEQLKFAQENASVFPQFIASDQGKAALQMVMEEFQGFCSKS